MLSFNPILSQSKATQSLKNPQLCWCSLRSPKFYFLICNTVTIFHSSLDTVLVTGINEEDNNSKARSLFVV